MTVLRKPFTNIFHLTLTGLVLISYCAIASAGDRLLATGGVTQVEGAAGGGLTPWALISGYGTDAQVGFSGFYTQVKSRGGFELDSGGISIGFHNRIEFSLAHTKFGLSNTVPNESIRMNTMGVKIRLVGDAVYDQDLWLPQLAVGAQFKHNEDFDLVPKTLGAKDASGIDYYLSASKLYLGAIDGRNLLLSATLQVTKANQFGLLGFGGDKNDGYRFEPAFSAAVMITDQLLTGMEYRYKPDNLNVFEEEDAKDVFVTWFPYKNFSVTGAYVDLGNIANKANQTAWYLSGQISY
jgi:Protein of unknown function (DUF3034)